MLSRQAQVDALAGVRRVLTDRERAVRIRERLGENLHLHVPWAGAGNEELPWLPLAGQELRRTLCAADREDPEIYCRTIALHVPPDGRGGTYLDKLERALFTREERGLWLARSLLEGSGLEFERDNQSAISSEPLLGEAPRPLRDAHIADLAQRWALVARANLDLDRALLWRLYDWAELMRTVQAWHCVASHGGWDTAGFVGSCSLDVLLLLVLAERLPGVGWVLEQVDWPVPGPDFPRPGSDAWAVWLDRAMTGPCGVELAALQDALVDPSTCVVGELLDWAWRVGHPLKALGHATAGEAELFVELGDKPTPELALAREVVLARGLIDRVGTVEASPSRHGADTMAVMRVGRLGSVAWPIPGVLATSTRFLFHGRREVWW